MQAIALVCIADASVSSVRVWYRRAAVLTAMTIARERKRLMPTECLVEVMRTGNVTLGAYETNTKRICYTFVKISHIFL